ncbi:hypothetical protein PMAYCL1PPCAC_20693 [Pristionchus mayeri]|uniref:TGF-beta family profile domain-containing protein n=1 Tax=Pristionchus mayeri TaxID=1317129 RepID=A0AAN5CTL7_9BILA|nr:hypothetical protein PMAYCL1PPCAC_20693 [Pristionchus mayeri]
MKASTRAIGLWTILLLIGFSSGNLRSEMSSLERAHQKNIQRVRDMLMDKTNMSPDDEMPDPVRMEQLRVQFAHLDWPRDEQDLEQISLIGHAYSNTSTVVSFQFGHQLARRSIETANIIFYIRRPALIADEKVLVQVTDDYDLDLGSSFVPVPNVRSEHIELALDAEAVQRALVRAVDVENERYFSIRLSAKANKWEELVLVKNRDGHREHMGVVIQLQVPRENQRRKRDAKSHRHGWNFELSGECLDDDQKTCCVHKSKKNISFKEMGFHHILQPVEFPSTICRGGCSEADGYHYTDYKHTSHRQSIMEHVKGENRCCLPVEYGHQQVVWQTNEGGVVQKLIPNFYVLRCSCD